MPPVYTTGISQNPAQAYVDLPQVTRDYLATGESPGNRDNALFAAACQFRDAGYSQQEAAAALIPRAEADGFSEAYAIKKLESAYSRSARQPCRSRGSNHSGAACSSTAAPRVEQTSEPVRSEHVRLDPKGSKARPLPNPIAEGYRVMLETCFLPGEGVSIGDGTRNSEGELVLSAGQVLPLEHWLKRLRSKSIMDIYPAREGVFVRINPVWLPRGKTDADVTAFRYLLIDFDEDANGHRFPRKFSTAGWWTVICPSIRLLTQLIAACTPWSESMRPTVKSLSAGVIWFLSISLFAPGSTPRTGILAVIVDYRERFAISTTTIVS